MLAASIGHCVPSVATASSRKNRRLRGAKTFKPTSIVVGGTTFLTMPDPDDIESSENPASKSSKTISTVPTTLPTLLLDEDLGSSDNATETVEITSSRTTSTAASTSCVSASVWHVSDDFSKCTNR